jgi:hypothetical protein
MRMRTTLAAATLLTANRSPPPAAPTCSAHG